MTLPVIWLLVAVCGTTADAQLRIVTYNTAGGPHPGLGTVLEAIGNESVGGINKPIDILALQEQHRSGMTTQSIVDFLNDLYGDDIYDMANLEGTQTQGGVGLPGLIYNRTSIELIDHVAFGTTNTLAQARQTLRYQLRPVGYGPSADFYVYSNHYKAGAESTDQDRRFIEATVLRADLDTLGEGTHAILAGDYNIRSSDEPSYQLLLAGGPGQAFDPLNAPGEWHNSAELHWTHTQAPAKMANGLFGGGMDDRFDFQLVTGEFLDGEGLDYIAGSYRAFGNDGSHQLNESITTGTGAAPEVLAALTTASDHLPVVVDYQLPAVLEAVAGPYPRVIGAGDVFRLALTVRNAAPVRFAAGADELDYTITASGSFSLLGELSGIAMATEGGIAHHFELVSSEVGNQSGLITISSNSQGAANPHVEIPVDFEVLPTILSGDYNGDSRVTQEDLDLVLLNWGGDAAHLPDQWISNLPSGLIDQTELDGVLLNWGNGVVAVARASVPEPGTAIMAVFMLTAASLRLRHRVIGISVPFLIRSRLIVLTTVSVRESIR